MNDDSVPVIELDEQDDDLSQNAPVYQPESTHSSSLPPNNTLNQRSDIPLRGRSSQFRRMRSPIRFNSRNTRLTSGMLAQRPRRRRRNYGGPTVMNGRDRGSPSMSQVTRRAAAPHSEDTNSEEMYRRGFQPRALTTVHHGHTFLHPQSIRNAQPRSSHFCDSAPIPLSALTPQAMTSAGLMSPMQLERIQDMAGDCVEALRTLAEDATQMADQVEANPNFAFWQR